jgi:hypothetical protein
MIAQIDIDECTGEVSDAVKSFLLREGGNPNGYWTYVNGSVQMAQANEELQWNTPRAKEELTDKGKAIRASELTEIIKDSMRKWGVTRLYLRKKDTGYGMFETDVVYLVETKRRVSLG